MDWVAPSPEESVEERKSLPEDVREGVEDLFRKAYETIGPERLIFGTDSSWLPRGFANRYLQDQLRVCHWLNMKIEDVALIFGGNARRLMADVGG